MKFLIDFSLIGRKVNSLKLKIIDAPKIFLSILNLDKNTIFGIDYLFELDKMKEKEKLFLYYLFNNKNILFNVENEKIILHSPFDYFLLNNLFNFKLFLKNENNQIHLKNEEFIPEIVFNRNYEAITLKKLENLYLIPTNGRFFVLNGQNIQPIKHILNTNIITEIFEEGEYFIDNETKNYILQKIEINKKFFNIPDIIELNDAEIEFYINLNDNYFELNPFLKIENEEIILDFEEIRHKTIFNEDFYFKNKGNKLYIVKNNSILYSKIKKINDILRSNFFGLLNEIKGTKIISKDTKTLFSKVLLQLKDTINIKINGKKSEIINLENEQFQIDWIKTDFKLTFQGDEISEREIKTFLEKGFFSKNNKILTSDYKNFDRKKQTLNQIIFLKSQLNKNKMIVPFLKDLSKELTITLPEKYNKLLEDFESIRKNRPNFDNIKLDNNILRNYQKTGVYWIYFLYKNGFGGILADEMGLGKSIQVLYFLYLIKENLNTSLIICPYALMDNWENEINKFFKGKFSYTIIKGIKKDREQILKDSYDYNILITSYSLLMQDIELYENKKFSLCIIDEAQHIKNKDTKRAISVKKINADFKLALTGTPIENYPIELWSIFDFVMPGYLGDHKWFKKNIETPILNNQNEAKEIFKKLISPYVLRRKKENVLTELPPKIEQEIEIELTEKQKILYLEIVNKTKEHLLNKIKTTGLASSYFDFLAVLTRLRQLAIHPGLIDEKLFEDENISSKINLLIELIFESLDSEHKIVIYSQFVKMLQFLQKILDKHNINSLYIDGKTKNRFEIVENFNSSTKEKILLASIKASGVGLNITGADSVIILDPWWNPTIEEQAIDRLHRIGQKKIVFVYKILTKGTIEEKMKILKQKKKIISNELTDFSENILKQLSISEIEELLKLE